MRHIYFRLILGIVFLACMIFSFFHRKYPFCADVPCSWRRVFTLSLFALEEK